jgi:hypothetical protein
MEDLLVLLVQERVYVEVHRPDLNLEIYVEFSVDDDMEVCNQVVLDKSYDRELHPMTKHPLLVYALLLDILRHLLLQVRNITMYHYYQLYK